MLKSGRPASNAIQTTDVSADQDQALLNTKDIDVQDVDNNSTDKKSNIRQKRARRAQGRQKVQFVDNQRQP